MRKTVRQCVECGKRLPASKVAAIVEVAPTPLRPDPWAMMSPLCSIACGAVAAVRLLEEMQA